MALTQIIDTIVQAETVNTLKPILAPLALMSQDFRADYSKSVTFKKSTAGSATQDNPTDYTTGASNTGAPVIVTLVEKNLAYAITPADKRNGWKLRDMYKTQLTQFANDIVKVVLANMPAATAATVVGTAANFTKKVLKKQTALVDAQEVGAILTPDYYTEVIPEEKTNLDLTEGAYGYDLGLYKVKTTGLPTSIVGGTFARGAIAVATALPESAEIEGVSYQDIMLEELGGLTIRVSTWADTNTRTEYVSFGVCIGSTVLDPDLVKSWKSA